MGDTPRIEELRRRIHLDPASIAFAALAEEYRKQGRFDEAIETCMAGLQRHPAYLSAHVTLGRALIAIGRYDEASQQLEEVLRVAPENLAAIRGLAEIHNHRRGALHHEQQQAPAAADVPSDPLPLEAPAPAPEPIPAAIPVRVAEAPVDPVLRGLEAMLASIVTVRQNRISAAR